MKNLVFYGSYHEAVKELPEPEQGKVYKAIIDYAFEQKMPKLNGVAKAIFVLIKPSLDVSIKNFENGIKGGRPSKNNPDKNQEETEEQTQKIIQIETQNETEIETQIKSEEQSYKNLDKRIKDKRIKEESKKKDEKEKIFVPPTLEEVQGYAKSRNSSVNPNKFFDFYEAGKWKDSKGNPVRNWKQKFITWENKDNSRPQEQHDSQLMLAAKRLGVTK